MNRTGWRRPHVAAHRAASSNAVICSGETTADGSKARGLQRAAIAGFTGTPVSATRSVTVLTVIRHPRVKNHARRTLILGETRPEKG
jgi:hypothetical protein